MAPMRRRRPPTSKASGIRWIRLSSWSRARRNCPGRRSSSACGSTGTCAGRALTLRPARCSSGHHEQRQLRASAGAPARAAEHPDLCPHRRRPGGGGLAVLAEHPRRRPVAALGGARHLHRRRNHRHPRWLFRPHLGADVLARAHARPDRRQAPGRRLPLDAGGGGEHPRLVAARRHHHPLPRDSRFRACANISPSCASACR